MISNIQRDTEGRILSGMCRCGEEVELGEFTNECENCNALYNWAGQELRPESEWEEEW